MRSTFCNPPISGNHVALSAPRSQHDTLPPGPGQATASHDLTCLVHKDQDGLPAEPRTADLGAASPNAVFAARLLNDLKNKLPPVSTGQGSSPALPGQVVNALAPLTLAAPAPWPRSPAHQVSFSHGHHNALIAAVRAGDLRAVKRFIQSMPFRLDDKDASGRSALHHAVEVGAETVVACLLEGIGGVRADPTVKTFFGVTPLHIAAARGNLRLISMLARRGADLNGVSSFNATALDLARHWGQRDAANVLLSWSGRSSSLPWALPPAERELLRDWLKTPGLHAVSHLLLILPIALMQLDEGVAA